ncbi:MULTISPECIES: DUF397 domain-containing protein [unclassified Streptomyces]|uniref:DUF397 domain-containing protein n=1 Tax=unclassified Streptomyces TaxID=2593676 RepID=UPI000DC7CBA0|nr:MULTISPECIES: DUF397 domain-containing protein [unclassified Streptomyces]AWZ09242.1 DUF397 domain-containing protein [Streptomyces sp. ICC4]AWZ17073.1 DUF397 domain-containing protein [Streptomyces sp. ICC1]
MNSSQLRWFKSSYSGSQGDSCVEVALSWHKSTYSGSQGDDCVEVAACADSVHIRDSKVDASPELAVTPGSWAAFLGGVTEA